MSVLLKVLLLCPISFKTGSKPLPMVFKDTHDFIGFSNPLYPHFPPTSLPDLLFCFSYFNTPICSCLGTLTICQPLRSLPDRCDSAHHSCFSIHIIYDELIFPAPPTPGSFILSHYRVFSA